MNQFRINSLSLYFCTPLAVTQQIGGQGIIQCVRACVTQPHTYAYGRAAGLCSSQVGGMLFGVSGLLLLLLLWRGCPAEVGLHGECFLALGFELQSVDLDFPSLCDNVAEAVPSHLTRA